MGTVLSLQVTRDGGFVYKDRTGNTTSSQLSLYGEGYANPNIIKIESHKEAINKTFTLIRLKYLDPDTASSYIEVGTSTVVSASNVTWKYGAKRLDLENPFIATTATAQGIANNLYNDYATPKLEIILNCRFLPQIDLMDRVDVNYASIESGSRVWDSEDWASDGAADEFDGLSWDNEDGENFDFSADPFIIIGKETNLGEFTTKLTLREA